jgi:methanogenic corrinoid protein MtbC1
MSNEDHGYQQELFQSFLSALTQSDKASCVKLIQTALIGKKISIIDLYSNLLIPSLNSVANNEKIQEINIWEEHIRSGIVRTIVEMAYPFVLAESAYKSDSLGLNIKALVFCLEEEYHEIGARINADYMTLLGFDVYFIGANTPKKEILSAIETLKPRVVSISVSNYYHLPKLNALIEEIQTKILEKPIILVGGYAVDHTPKAHEVIHPDFFIHNFEDIKRITEDLL